MAWPAFVAICGAALTLSYTDLTRRRLPNRLVAVLSMTVLALVVLSQPLAEGGGRGPALLAGLVAGLIGFTTYSANLIAAGDVKILPALITLEFWMGSTAQLIYLGVAIAAGIVALIWFLRSKATRTTASIPLGAILLIGVAPSALAIAPLDLL